MDLFRRCHKEEDARFPITSWRENVSSDEAEIVEILKKECTTQFENVDVSMIIDKSLFSISQVDSSGSIVSHVSLFAYPNIPVVPPSDWVYWAKQLYGLQQIKSNDSLFIHLITWKRIYSSEFLKPLIDIIFLHFSFLENVLLVAPPGIVMCEVLEDYFTKIFPKKLENVRNIQTLYLCTRKNHFPKLSIRRALQEDHDDLWALDEAQNIRLCSYYGEYYFSDIISHSPKNRVLLTAKRNNTIVGLMSLNTEVDVELLSQKFELKHFNGFHTPQEEDITPLRHLNVVNSIPKVLVANCENVSLSQYNEELSTIYENIPDTKHNVRERYEVKFLKICSQNGDECNGLKMMKSIGKELLTTSTFQDSNLPEVDHFLSSAITFQKEFAWAEAKWEKQARYHSTYYGKGNALCVELLAVHTGYDEREFIDLFKAPFDFYPEHDYFLISVPFTTAVSPLIHHFVRCIPKDQSDFPHNVYVLHRNAILSHISLRFYDHSDFEDVICLLKTIECHREVDINLLKSGKFGIKPCRTIIFESEGAIIGFATIREEEEVEDLEAHFKLENFYNFHNIESAEHGVIIQFILSPIFHRHTKFIIREILRLTDMDYLFYRLYPSIKVSNIMNALGEMMPVLPRKWPLYSSASKKREMAIQNCFALYLMNPKLTNRLSIHSNTRIILIGASTTALSFLESLVFSSARRFFLPQNITLVSPFGIPIATVVDTEADKFVMDQEFYSNEYLAQLSLSSWINIVCGYMTAINRKKKRITINNDTEFTYDYLIITTGEQFSDEFLKLKEVFHHSLQRKRQSDILRNSFSINSYKEASSLMKYLRKNFYKSSSRKIIVYGHSLEAYATIEALKRCQYPGYAIILVIHSDTVIMNCFNDIEVQQRVTKAMRKDDIEILRGYQLESWFVNSDKNELTNIRFSKGNDKKEFECLALINCGIKSTNKITSSAITESSLVYHNGLVIAQDFSTCDPFIFGAGSHTRYSKQRYAKEFEHRFYNSREVGKKLYKALRHLWSPSKKRAMEANEFQFLQYKEPIIKACKVPGGNYLQIHKPGIHIPSEKATGNLNQETALLTDDCSPKRDPYFHIHLNTSNVIEGITCYSVKDLNIGNIIILYGKHKKSLNYLLKHCELGQRMDCKEHFSPLCPNAISYDGFSKIYAGMKTLFKTVHEYEEAQSCELNKVLWKIKGNKETEEDTDLRICKDFVINEIKKFLPKTKTESVILEWMKEIKAFLPNQEQIPIHQGNILQNTQMDAEIKKMKDTSKIIDTSQRNGIYKYSSN